MNNKEIYLVERNVDYESNDVICAFLDKTKAQEFLDEINQYEDSRIKETPPIGDSEENNLLWSKWLEVQENWKNNHPAKEFSRCDYYSIVTVEIR